VEYHELKDQGVDMKAERLGLVLKALAYCLHVALRNREERTRREIEAKIQKILLKAGEDFETRAEFEI